VDASAVVFYLASQAEGDSAGGLFIAGLVALVGGFGLIFAAYRAFRYGEEYEYRASKKKFSLGKQMANLSTQINNLSPQMINLQVKDVESWINKFN
jgi:hypothetical protein